MHSLIKALLCIIVGTVAGYAIAALVVHPRHRSISEAIQASITHSKPGGTDLAEKPVIQTTARPDVHYLGNFKDSDGQVYDLGHPDA